MTEIARLKAAVTDPHRLRVTVRADDLRAVLKQLNALRADRAQWVEPERLTLGKQPK